jgi:hypothetical protein
MCRVQPTAPEIDRVAVIFSDAECSPPDPIARFEQQHIHAGIDKAARRGNSGGAGADHDNIVLIGDFCHLSLLLNLPTASSQPRAATI